MKAKTELNALLGLEIPEKETKDVLIPRLGLTLTLQEIGYDELMRCRRREDAKLAYFLASVKAPDFRSEEFYKEKMGCASPADAVKKLFRSGEIERVCIAADALNGYKAGSVVSVDAASQDLESHTVAAILEDYEKN